MVKFLSILCLGAALALPVQAVEFDLYTNNITMPTGRTFQMPLTASDPGGGPLTFSVVSVKPKMLSTAISPVTNRSLVINISAVDSNNTPFTGDVTIHLFEDLMPKTTSRIIDLVNSNFYNGLLFTRIVQDFVCQGGTTNADGSAETGVIIPDEYVSTLQFTGFGQLALANSGHNKSEEVYFITDVDLSVGNPNKLPPQDLDFRYNLFGQVTRGFDVISELISTPVDTTNNDFPLTPAVMNTVTLTNDREATVLALAAGRSFTGNVQVVVSAMNSSHQKVEQTINVTIVPNQVTDLPFFVPFPPSLTFTQGQSAFFPIRATDIDGNPLNLDGSSFNTVVPTNLNLGIVAGNLWMVPSNNSTGTEQMVLGVYDFQQNIANEDTSQTTITIDPMSATPTLNIIPKSGTITDNAATNASSINISGTFTAITPPIHTFTNIDLVILTVGDINNPFVYTNFPTFTGTTAKKGVLTIKTPKGAVPTINAQFSSKGTFKIGLSNFNFPAAQSNQMEVGLQIGPDYGTNVQVWTENKPGVFTLPKP